MRTTGRLPFSFRPPDIPHGPKGTCRARQTSRFELDVVGHCKRVVVVERGKGSDYRTLSDLASPRFFFLLQIDFGQGTDTIFAYISLYQKLPVAFQGITLRPKFEAEAPKMVVYILYPEYLHDSSQVVHVKTGELEKLQADRQLEVGAADINPVGCTGALASILAKTPHRPVPSRCL